MLNIKTLGLLIDSSRDIKFPKNKISWLEKHSIKVIALPWDKAIDNSKKLDIIIVMGGDGTVLHGLGMYPTTPILAINYGTVGFLTAGDKEELDTILERLLTDKYIISERCKLQCSFKNQKVDIVNEIVIKGSVGLISVDCFVNSNHVRHIRGDGVIVGTPTGSTAYLLSAGSPVVMPEVKGMILSGLNEYNFSARALVLPQSAHIQLKITPSTRQQDIHLIADGKNITTLSINDEIRVSASEQNAKLVYLDGNYFFSNLSSRLNW